MAFVIYPLDGVTYTASDVETYLCTRQSGVYSDEDCFDITINGRNATIGTGLAWINSQTWKGKSVYCDANVVVAIPEASSNDRIDRIVLRINFNTKTAEITLLQGTPAASPTAPAITRNTNYYDLALYDIAVDSGSTAISTEDVTDKRLDAEVCGLMKDGVTTIPTATLQAQLQTLLTQLSAAMHIDSAVSDTSTNTIQNKIIKAYVDAHILAYKDNAITANTDLNSVTTAGKYNIYPSSTAQTISNIPEIANGTLIVMQLFGSSRLLQLYITATNRIWHRYGSSSGSGYTWNAWKTVVDDDFRTKTEIAMFGDSITWGRDGNGTYSDQVTLTIPKIVEKSLNADVTNFGVGGIGWSSNTNGGTDTRIAYDLLSAQDLSSYDVVTLAFGANDSASKLGTYTDAADAEVDGKKTIMGQIKKAVDYIYSQNALAQIVLFAPIQSYTTGSFPTWSYAPTRTGGFTMYELIEEMARFADRYHIAFVDCFDSPTGKVTGTTYSDVVASMFPDKLHPSANGYKVLGKYFAGKIGNLTSGNFIS